jgi:hypothetical protein
MRIISLNGEYDTIFKRKKNDPHYAQAKVDINWQALIKGKSGY